MNELTEINNNLSLQESDRFDDLEICIANGLQTFVEVGNALAEIRDGRLYRVHYDTFEDYCQKRWGLARRHAYRLIDASTAFNNVSNWTQTPPATESQARPLTSLTPEQQKEVWQTAVNTAPNGKMTAAHVEATKKEYLTPQYQEYDETETASGYFEDDYNEPYTVAKQPASQTPHTNGNYQTSTLPQEETKKPHVSHNSGNNEWYTPVEIIEAARQVLGVISLDPASSPEANEIVKAATYYTVDDDGLEKEWFGNVWMNPPYASDLIGKFSEKLHKEYISGNVVLSLVLVNNATETQWFRLLTSAASAICFPSSRVKFWKPDGSTGQPLQGQAVLYFGENIKAFADAFSHIGFIVEVING